MHSGRFATHASIDDQEYAGLGSNEGYRRRSPIMHRIRRNEEAKSPDFAGETTGRTAVASLYIATFRLPT